MADKKHWPHIKGEKMERKELTYLLTFFININYNLQIINMQISPKGNLFVHLISIKCNKTSMILSLIQYEELAKFHPQALIIWTYSSFEILLMSKHVAAESAEICPVIATKNYKTQS